MTDDEVERAIEFLLEHHAKVSADIERHSEQIAQLTAAVAEMKVEMRAGFDETRAGFDQTRAGFREVWAGFGETRKAIDDLIVTNEVTRKLAEDVARLAIATSQRVTNLESNQ